MNTKDLAACAPVAVLILGMLAACARVASDDEPGRAPGATIEPATGDTGTAVLPASIEEAVALAAARGNPLGLCPSARSAGDRARGGFALRHGQCGSSF